MGSFITEQRAAAPLVGAMFLFGFLVIGLSLYQAQIVPQENIETEFQHNQEIQNDLIEIRDIIHSNGVSEMSHSVSVTLGVNYNQRIIAINPPAPTGTISTVDPGSNISIIPDSDTETTEHNLTTKFITYEPQYREYQNAPLSTIEHTLLYNSFSETDAQLTVSGQQIFDPDDNTLTIPVLEGDVLETQTNAVSVRLTTLEREEQSISDNVTVTLPTNAPSLWIDEIESQPNIRLVAQTESSVTVDANVSTLALYRLEISEVPQNDPTNSLADRFGELVPDGPIFCTVCDGTDDEKTEHDTINEEDDFADETLIIPEGTDFVPPEGSEGDDQGDSVEYTFKSYEIGGTITSNESVKLTSTDGDIRLTETGSTISGKQFDFDANGDIIIDGATLSTTAGSTGAGNERMTLTATGNISGVESTLNATQEIDATAEGEFIDFSRATLESGGDIKLDAEEGDLFLTDATVESDGNIIINAAGSVDLSGAEITAEGDIRVNAGAEIDASQAELVAQNIEIESTGGNVEVGDSRLEIDNPRGNDDIVITGQDVFTTDTTFIVDGEEVGENDVTINRED